MNDSIEDGSAGAQTDMNKIMEHVQLYEVETVYTKVSSQVTCRSDYADNKATLTTRNRGNGMAVWSCLSPKFMTCGSETYCSEPSKYVSGSSACHQGGGMQNLGI